MSAGHRRRLRWGMVGGASGIGPIHRFAANLDSDYELAAGVFSRDVARNRTTGEALHIPPERLYPDVATMVVAEQHRTDGIDCVSIVTPNDSHAPISLAFLERGIAVICEKPMATSSADAMRVMRATEQHRVPFALTHNYSAYPVVLQARHLVQTGRLGTIRVVQAEYASGSRSRLVEAEGDARFIWRADPVSGGPSTVLGDIGTHAHHLLRTVTGLEVAAVSADLAAMVSGRMAHDNANLNLRFVGGARGQLWASMVACGTAQGLRIRVFGEHAALDWHQEFPNELFVNSEREPNLVFRRGDPWLCDEAKRATRTIRGQPEGYLEAFANLYRDFAEVVRAWQDGRMANPSMGSFASARDGVLGMLFVEAAVASNLRAGAWVGIKLQEPGGSA